MLLLLIMEINSIGHILMLDVKNILIYHYIGMNGMIMMLMIMFHSELVISDPFYHTNNAYCF